MVRSWLSCIQHLLKSVPFWCTFGGSSVEVWTQNILYQFIESQFQFGMPSRGAKMSLAFNEPQTEMVALHSNLNKATSEHAAISQVERRNYWYCISYGSIILHMKSPIELKDNSTLQNLKWSESWVLSAYMGSLSDVVLGPEWVLWHFDLHPFLRLSKNVVTT